FILVKDVLQSLQQLAHHHRKQFDIPIIAITGSNGKTTTKELISAVLGSHYPTHFTKGNFNNHIGVPLTLLAMSADTEVAIIEMGANHVGEIAFLCEIAAPTHGLITNIGKAHLEGFGGIEGVKKGKGELYRYLEKHKGLAFVNKSEQYLTEIAGSVLYKVFYTESLLPDLNVPIFETKLVAADPFVKIAYLSKKGVPQVIQSQLIGAYNFNNIMTAVTLGRYFKVPYEKIKAAIETYTPSNNRSQIVEKDTNKFLLDAYNANPTSMKSALESFASYAENKKVAILGDMLELGEFSEQAHRQIIELANQLGIEVLTVGKEFSKTEQAHVRHFINTSSLKDWFWQQQFEDTFFLLKGSRGIGLEKLLQ
ncbi:MAG: UDP-N-acetylmuramoyl-tripeptide--D-alanyl-D-alanine ligase, partial [Bacteroidota bacterium]